MADLDQVKFHPLTGKELLRGTRKITLKYKKRSVVVDMPGWYATDDFEGEDGIHDAKDMQVSSRAIVSMKAAEADLPTPNEIKKIRSQLQLTQRQASALLGGGRNAFQKYEAGDVMVSEPMGNLLRLLADEPRLLAKLKERKDRRATDNSAV